MITHYLVTTRDVDGSSKRKYTTLSKAQAYFESMLGHSIDSAIREMLPEMEIYPTFDTMSCVRGVSHFGCVVAIQKVTAKI